MKYKITFLLFSFFSFISCKQEDPLVLIELPDPEPEAIITLPEPSTIKAIKGDFQLKPLNYTFEKIAPHLDSEDFYKHYATYYLNSTNQLNKTIEQHIDWKNQTIEELLMNPKVPTEIKNPATIYFNHSIYFSCLNPTQKNKPSTEFSELINTNFGSFNEFKTKFINEAIASRKNGWIWLIALPNKKIQLLFTEGENNPYTVETPLKCFPLLGIDLREHAYHNRYPFSAKKYMEAIFEIIDWTVVSKNYQNAFIQNNPI